MHSVPQSIESVQDTGPELGVRPTDSVSPDLRPLIIFLRRPTFGSSARGRLTVWRWLGWVGLLLLVAFLSSVLDRILIQVFGWPVPIPSRWHYFLTHPSWYAFAMLLVAPALEELAFRAFLCTAPKFVFAGLPFFAFHLYSFIRMNVPAFAARISPAVGLAGYLYQFWPILPAAAVSLLLYRYQRDTVLAFFRHRAAWVFWTSCILFGAGHNLLYSNTPTWWAYALVMPQFLGGIGFAYLRIRFGLRWSIAAHYAVDILFALLAWLPYWAASSWLDLSAASPFGLLQGTVATLTAIRFVLMAYGFVVLWHVVRLRW